MIDRLIAIFNKNIRHEDRSNIWDSCFSYSTLVEINEENLNNMGNTNLCYGFFGGTQEVNTDEATTDRATITIVRLIERLIGFKIHLPEFIGGRNVLSTPLGIITDRHLHYLWILKRIIELCPDKNSSILEIGGGLGLLGYYLSKAGYMDYTNIDLAYPNLCQSYFLYKNLPERELMLSGESENPFNLKYKDNLKLLHSSDFENTPGRFDIIINIDSLPELTLEETEKYIKCDVDLLLSVNKGIDESLIGKYRDKIESEPFILRDGYIESLYKLKQQAE